MNRLSNGLDSFGTVLLVDDDEATRAAFSAMLAPIGYFVFCAPNGAAALESLRMARPDAVVTDLDMPLLGGIDLCLAIRADQRFRHLPVIAASSLQPDESTQSALFDLYLRKPVPPERLVSAVAAFVQSRPGAIALASMPHSQEEESEPNAACIAFCGAARSPGNR
ncbi:response regulator [Trinickia dinghuensis]|uniref:Response regulator n=2 Tax=Trinickia dinghuensis TaxID=2291023 RepID=A0A3D8K4P7_9BURK|nr:response regulator [Trinickia dinghuensis]